MNQYSKYFLNRMFAAAAMSIFSSTIFAANYGEVVRIQSQRTGQYLSYNQAADTGNTKRIFLSDNANNDTLWIIKGPLSGAVSASNQYDRWNCTFGQAVPSNGYAARLEHLVSGQDAYFGNYYAAAASAGRVYPYTFLLGQDKLSDSSAVHYYNFVLNLHSTNKILVSNEYVTQFNTSNEAIITQDTVVDTWTIIPVYAMNDSQRTLQGQALVDSLNGAVQPPAPAPAPAPAQSLPLHDQLINEVMALINFYNNETNYRGKVTDSFEGMATTEDINQRISILQALGTETTGYNNQNTSIFGTITHSSIAALIASIINMLNQNRSSAIDLQNQLAALQTEIDAANNELSSIGASSVIDLKSKINQLVALLNTLWQ